MLSFNLIIQHTETQGGYPLFYREGNKRRTICIFLFATVLFACSSCAKQKPQLPNQKRTLTILAAASLTEPFYELGRQFEAGHPDTKVEFNFSGSQQLAQQLSQGAAADIFASANQKYMDTAVQNNRILENCAKIFVKNRLVVIFPKENPAGIKELKDLANPGMKLDFAAQAVPAGQYSLDFLEKASRDSAFGITFKAGVLMNVVSYEENVKAVLTKVALGEADAGIVYASDISGGAADKVSRLDIPDALNVIAIYPIAVIKDSENTDLAKAFIDLVLSPAGQGLLAMYHFIPAAE
jgi:molybdate transport system substrate-binding protein